MAISNNGNVNIVYQTSLGSASFRSWDESWSTAYSLSDCEKPKLSANSNDIYIIYVDHWNSYSKIWLRQKDYAPLAPQNLSVSAPNFNHPKVTWDHNQEADLKIYKVYKKTDETDWAFLDTTSNNYYWDENETIICSMGSVSMTVHYRATAVDQFDNESDYSNDDDIVVQIEGGKPPDLKIADVDIIPEKYYVSQNYPNPFNPETTIKFGIPEDNFVNLEVYNVQGQKVATLVDERLSAGSYNAKFNATSLPSGAYFYRITAGSYLKIKRMLLVK